MVPFLNFEDGLGVPLSNFRRVLGPTFKLEEGREGVPGPGVLVPLLHYAQLNTRKYVRTWDFKHLKT